MREGKRTESKQGEAMRTGCRIDSPMPVPALCGMQLQLVGRELTERIRENVAHSFTNKSKRSNKGSCRRNCHMVVCVCVCVCVECVMKLMVHVQFPLVSNKVIKIAQVQVNCNNFPTIKSGEKKTPISTCMH